MRKISCLVLALLGCATSQSPPPNGPRQAPYKGWTEALFMEASERRISLISVPPAAGRVVHYALSGENILFENPDYLGRTLANTTPDQLAQGYIGYNIDLGPELRGIPRHLSLWMGPCSWKWEHESVILSSAPDPTVGIQIDKDMKLDATTGDLNLVQTMRNTGQREQSYCLWDRTLCKGGGFALVPLGTKSRFNTGWSLLKDGGYRGGDPIHPNVKILSGVLVAQAQGKSSKLGLDSDAGWIAYARGKLLFIKYFPYFPEGPYTDGGNSVEVYFDPNVCELEPLSPERTLKPGDQFSFPEKWMLLALDHEVTCAEEARALVDRIPPSPFGR